MSPAINFENVRRENGSPAVMILISGSGPGLLAEAGNPDRSAANQGALVPVIVPCTI